MRICKQNKEQSSSELFLIIIVYIVLLKVDSLIFFVKKNII